MTKAETEAAASALRGAGREAGNDAGPQTDRGDTAAEAPDGPDQLASGIAMVLMALRGADGGDDPTEAPDEVGPADAVTYRLLGELDRIWHTAS